MKFQVCAQKRSGNLGTFPLSSYINRSISVGVDGSGLQFCRTSVASDSQQTQLGRGGKESQVPLAWEILPTVRENCL